MLPIPAPQCSSPPKLIRRSSGPIGKRLLEDRRDVVQESALFRLYQGAAFWLASENQGEPMTTKWIYVNALALTLAFATNAVGGPAYGGGSPKGKPFVELLGQIVEVQGEVNDLTEQVSLLRGDVDSIEELVADNQAIIAQLQVEDDALQAQIDMLGTDIVATQSEISRLDAEDAELLGLIETNSGDIEALQAQIDSNEAMITQLKLDVLGLESLEERIATNEAMIDILESELLILQAELQEKQDRIDGFCPGGEAITAIDPDGSITCDDFAQTTSTTRFHRISATVAVGRGKGAHAVVGCPSDSLMVAGGGVISTRVGNALTISTAFSTNAWQVYGVSESGFSTGLTARVLCERQN
jgi:hypothetical protein